MGSIHIYRLHEMLHGRSYALTCLTNLGGLLIKIKLTDINGDTKIPQPTLWLVTTTHYQKLLYS